MRKSMGLVMASIAMATLISGSTAFAAKGSISGTINGHGCAHHGETCPVSTLDPHLALEPDFVIQKANGDYYFMTDLPRSTKVRYALKNVTVTGEIDERYKNIFVDEFKVDGKTVWSRTAQEEEREKLYAEGNYAF